MSEPTGNRVRVVLRWIQILDTLEPSWKDKGEFRFTARVSTENGAGVIRETRFPEQGHYDISDHPAWNKVIINRTLFDDVVQDHLLIELEGVELDLFTPNDSLDSYRREFRGAPETWVGWYGPPDDWNATINAADPENMSNWRVCYIIETD